MIDTLYGLREIVNHTTRLVIVGLGLGLLLAITPVFAWLLIPILGLYASGYRITDGGTEWTDDIEEYLKAVEDNK